MTIIVVVNLCERLLHTHFGTDHYRSDNKKSITPNCMKLIHFSFHKNSEIIILIFSSRVSKNEKIKYNMLKCVLKYITFSKIIFGSLKLNEL